MITPVANVGLSDYNSFQMKVNMNQWQGLSFLSGYTGAKAINNSPGPFPGAGAAGRTTPTDAGGLSRGLADFDVNHRFTFAGTYDIPVSSNFQGAARQWKLLTPS